MSYGDLQFFDIIIFAGIAIFLVFRLRKVLGRRSGFEKKHINDQDLKKAQTEKANQKIPELDDNFLELKKAYATIDNFDHNIFLEGAKAAFESIINAFNIGDKKHLGRLLTNEVLKIFESEIDKKNNDPDSQIFSLNIKEVESVSIKNDKIFIKIRFVSEQFKNNDETTIRKKEDVWSFEKIIKSKDPNWLLSTT